MHVLYVNSINHVSIFNRGLGLELLSGLFLEQFQIIMTQNPVVRRYFVWVCLIFLCCVLFYESLADNLPFDEKEMRMANWLRWMKGTSFYDFFK